MPYAMGADLSAIDFSLQNSPELQLLLGLLVAKILMTITTLGLGIPGGIIGPILGIGAIIGTCISVLAMYFMPGNLQASDFALMGMAGFMAATLNAPLAALLCVVEMSNQIEIIVPAMIVIASSCISSGQFFRNRSIFIMQLEVQGLAYRRPPIEKSLQRVGVIGVMQEQLIQIADNDNKTIAATISEHTSHQHVIIKKENLQNESEYIWCQPEQKNSDNSQSIVRHKLIPLSNQSTLAEAYLLLVRKREGGVYIYQDNPNDIMGIITFDAIRSYLLKGKTH
jgi:hypothetical protein